MRVPLKGSDKFCLDLNSVYSRMEQAYFGSLKSSLKTSAIKVMLGDGTITDSVTFDPQETVRYFNILGGCLKGWSNSGVSKSNTDDLHRATYQISNQIEKYYISVHFEIQFHSLKFYRVDKRVLEIQKEIHELSRKSNKIHQSLANTGNEIVVRELRNMGYGDLPFEDLLEKMLSDQVISSQLEDKAKNVMSQYPELGEVEIKERALGTELNDYIMEVYTIDPVVIDYNKLMQGEVGVVLYMDIEIVNNMKSKERQAYVNIENIKADSRKRLIDSLDKLTSTIKDIEKWRSEELSLNTASQKTSPESEFTEKS
ncbi:MAG: hypothetical protein M3530_07365 [Thermoproteota archaeon]|nr:hypothetical protein [Thermoproteota archaeon]